MKISSKSGVTARFLSYLSFIGLILVVGWKGVGPVMALLAGDTSALLLVPLSVVVVPLVLIIIWAGIGGHYEWDIGDRHLRIRSRRLTAWKRDVVITPEQIDTIDRELHNVGGDRDNGLPCHTLVVTLIDGRRFVSPRMYDDAQINRAWRKLEALLQRATIPA